MAVTGFWPVCGNLNATLKYADNPDKTTPREYLDEDLYAALRYAKNDDKTDKEMFVGGINCSKQNAYAEMVAVQRRFGMKGKVVGYHGIQSFAEGEVTPEQAFEIGKETARRMWGDRYQVLVTVHLNTDNLHCHFVVNPCSFVDGQKFKNKIGDHKELRRISDEICREHGLSVLENSEFYSKGKKKEYWVHKSGQKTHRDCLREDIEYILPTCGSIKDFRYQMEALGYTFGRTDEYYAHTTITAPGWKRPIRLDSLGYSREVLDERINANWDKGVEFYAVLSQRIQKWRTTALEDEINRLEFTVEHSYDTVTVLVDTLFLILITVLQMAEDLLSPDLRHEARNIEQYVSDYRFLQREEIHTIPQLEQRISDTKEQIAALELDRSKADNTRRRGHTRDEAQTAKDERKAITEKIRPLREKVKRAEKIMEKSPHLYELLQSELDVECVKPVQEQEIKIKNGVDKNMNNNTMKTPVAIPVSKLHPFEGHPYKVLDNEEMNTLIESIQTQGILSPLIVRPMENTTDEYEVVSGHRRLHAAVKAGLETVPAFIYALDRDAAAIAVVDSNLHREHILPSEKAFAYKMKLDAMKHQGKTSCQVGTKSRTDEQMAENSDDSARQIQRYIRLTNLIPELLAMMDEGKIALSVGVELSFLPEQFQYDILEICDMNDCTPSYSQSWHLHQFYKDGVLDKYLIFKTLSEEKANQREIIKVPVERLKNIVPESYTVKQTEDFLIKAAEYYHRNIIRQRNRDSR